MGGNFLKRTKQCDRVLNTFLTPAHASECWLVPSLFLLPCPVSLFLRRIWHSLSLSLSLSVSLSLSDASGNIIGYRSLGDLSVAEELSLGGQC